MREIRLKIIPKTSLKHPLSITETSPKHSQYISKSCSKRSQKHLKHPYNNRRSSVKHLSVTSQHLVRSSISFVSCIRSFHFVGMLEREKRAAWRVQEMSDAEPHVVDLLSSIAQMAALRTIQNIYKENSAYTIKIKTEEI